MVGRTAEAAYPDARPRPGCGIRLALFSDTYAPQVNGVSRTLERLVEAICQRGGEVRVFTTSDPRASPAERDIVRFRSLPFWAEKHLRIALPTFGTVHDQLKAWRPDIVHIATAFGVGIAGRAAARSLRIPLVTSYHTSLTQYSRHYGLTMLTPLSWTILRWFHNGGLRTYCPSKAIESELKHQGFVNVSRWSRGVDAQRFNPSHRSTVARRLLGAAADTVIMAYVGRIASEKGLAGALEGMNAAAAQLPRRFLFAFAGDGPLLTYCRSHAPPHSVFAGRIVGKELSEFYASADIFVFPSTTDTFGNVLHEAMASGLPIVAADSEPTREVLRDGESRTPLGRLFPGKDPNALAAQLVELALDAELRVRMARHSRAVAMTRTWDNVFDELFEDYERVIGRR
ncbi:MAG: glycosyltransferase family 4 protein [Gemmatimonadaceae bacterium]